MRVINRTAITLAGAQPYIDWIRSRDADFNKGGSARRRFGERQWHQ
jgi:hypothetical protein